VPIPLNVPVIWPVLVLFTSAVSAEMPKHSHRSQRRHRRDEAGIPNGCRRGLDAVCVTRDDAGARIVDVASLPLIPIPPVMVPSLLTVAPYRTPRRNRLPFTVAPAWIL